MNFENLKEYFHTMLKELLKVEVSSFESLEEILRKHREVSVFGIVVERSKYPFYHITQDIVPPIEYGVRLYFDVGLKRYVFEDVHGVVYTNNRSKTILEVKKETHKKLEDYLRVLEYKGYNTIKLSS